jgi:predicted transcriptional regulator of viral defense system
MRYLELKTNLKDFKIFSINDIRKIDNNFHRRRLNEWQDKGYIKKIVKGYYIFSDTTVNDAILYYIANKIYGPSYISLEIALSYYNLLPESVYCVTSVSTKRTYNFKTSIAEFSYRSIKPELFFGYEIIKPRGGIMYKIADFEKALLDYLYFNPHYNTKKDYEELRINRDIFWENIDEVKLYSYLDRFAQKKLLARTKKLLRFLKND